MSRRVQLALLVAVLVGGCRGQTHDAKPEADAKPGEGEGIQSAPPVTDLEGHTVDPLQPDANADVLLFLRTDCPISNRYAPEIGRIAARFEGQAAKLWLVYVDPDETPDEIRAHIEDYRLPGTPLRDPGQTLVPRAGVRVTPEAAVFDAGGERRYVGRIDDWYVDYGKSRAEASTHELVDAMAAVLEGRTPQVSAAKAVGCPLPPLPEPRSGAPG